MLHLGWIGTIFLLLALYMTCEHWFMFFKAIWWTLKWIVGPVAGIGLLLYGMAHNTLWAMVIVYAFDAALLLFGAYMVVYYCLIKMGLAKPAQKAD
ncbi:hypothetical protein [Rhizobium sp. L43]|uniref:hypothetical protein n=1 Tax=Rhizobium sp. L43 TaxID=2035452 RepID=UPI000BE8C6BF|nr:hypothetical protein [Rhizobium sp. L43]PDS75444.1 hypothetical protein CO667_26545 [Rhizobium sp. L43]